jgi:hypothetical protein
MKLKKCQNDSCGKKFEPRQIGQRACSTACALLYIHAHPEIMERIGKRSAALQRAKARKERRDGLEKLKSRSAWLKDCQRAFNAMINRRDLGKPCIACNLPIVTVVHASHYRTVASSPHLRYDERNCHSGCVKCNVFLVGNVINYRSNLIKRIGLKEVECLESDSSVKKWTITEIKEMESNFRRNYL